MATRKPAALVAFAAALGVAVWSVLRPAEPPANSIHVAAQALQGGALQLQGRDAKVSAAPGAERERVGQIARELRDAPDLYAAYLKYKDARDPTGRISYLLAGWIDDCLAYIHDSPEAMDRYFSVTPEMLRNAKRNEMLTAAVARCAGFGKHSKGETQRFAEEMYKELHRRSREEGNVQEAG